MRTLAPLRFRMRPAAARESRHTQNSSDTTQQPDQHTPRRKWLLRAAHLGSRTYHTRGYGISPRTSGKAPARAAPRPLQWRRPQAPPARRGRSSRPRSGNRGEDSRVSGGTGKGDRSTGKRRTESCLRSEHRALDSSAGHWIIRARDGGTQADIARVSHASRLSLKKV